MNPFIGAGLITGGAGLLSGIFGSASAAKGAKYAADKSLQATRETNAQNYKIWQEQRQYAIDAWNAENSYNSPAAQKARLRAAGYNPYLAFGDVGNTGGSISQPAAPQMVAPPESAFPNTQGIFAEGLNNAFQNALNVLQSAVQMQNVSANTKKTSQETSQQGEMFPYLLDSAKYGSISAKFKADSDSYLPKFSYEDYIAKKRENYIGELTKDLQIETVDATLQQVKAQTALIKLNASAQETLNKYLDQNQQLDLMTKAQSLCNLVEQGKLTRQQVKNAIAQEVLTYAQANGQALENEFNKKTFDNRVEQVSSQTDILKNQEAASQYLPGQAEATQRKLAIDADTAERTADAIVQGILFENGDTGVPFNDAMWKATKTAGSWIRNIGSGIIGGF